MDLSEKIALMKKYDFNTKPSYAYEYFKPFKRLIADIKDNVNCFSRSDIDMDSDEIRSELNFILAAYGYVRAYYDTVDFDKLDKNDPDFAVLYKTNELLPQLGKEINHFLRWTDNGSSIEKICNKILNADKPEYSQRIKQLEAQLKH
jgi:hypothetical protein